MEQTKIDFLKNHNVDIESGIKNTLDFETYNEILNDFFTSLPKEINNLNNLLGGNDIANYTINVHALKSNARVLGFMELGEVAYQHEMAGKSNDINFITSNFNNLVTSANQVITIINEYKTIGG